MVVGFTTTYAIVLITTKVISSNPADDEVYSIEHYVIKFVGYLGQVGGFLLVLRLTIGNHNANCIMLIGKWRHRIMCNNVNYSPLRQQT